jgi:hypothetical protein
MTKIDSDLLQTTSLPKDPESINNFIKLNEYVRCAGDAFKIYLGKDNHIYTQTNFKGTIGWLISLIQFLERCIYEKSLPSEEARIKDLLACAQESLKMILTAATNHAKVEQSPAFKQNISELRLGLQELATSLEEGKTFPNSKARSDLIELTIEGSSQLATLFQQTYPLRGPPDRFAENKTVRIFLETPPEKTEEALLESFEKLQECKSFREDLKIALVPYLNFHDHIRVILQNNSSQEVLEHAARHICTFSKAIESYKGIYSDHVRNLDTQILASKAWITHFGGEEILFRVSREPNIPLPIEARNVPSEKAIPTVPAASIEPKPRLPVAEEFPIIITRHQPKLSSEERSKMVVHMFKDLGTVEALKILQGKVNAALQWSSDLSIPWRTQRQNLCCTVR